MNELLQVLQGIPEDQKNQEITWRGLEELVRRARELEINNRWEDYMGEDL